jgi:hypothetical protein
MNLRRLVTGSFAFTSIKAKEALLGKAASAPLSSDLSRKPEIPITPIRNALALDSPPQGHLSYPSARPREGPRESLRASGSFNLSAGPSSSL